MLSFRLLKACMTGAIIFLPVIANATEPLVIENETSYDDTVPVGGSWYIRGDFGVSVLNDPSFSYSFNNGPVNNLSSEEFGNSFNWGFGVGRKVNDYFRSDLTFDVHSDFDFSGDDVPGDFPCDLSPGPGSCDQTLTSDVEIYTGMLNGYFDLGSFNGFTPYVGGGIGASYVRFTDFSINGVCEGCVDPTFNSYQIRAESNSELEFAYQLTAGASIAISDSAAIDFSYRYLDISDGVAVEQATNIPELRYEDLESNDFRIGFRYTLQ